MCSKGSKDEDDAWYNLLSNLEDEDDDSLILSFTLLVRPAPATTLTAFTMPKTERKEHLTSVRIKAIYMLEEKKSVAQIKEVTGVRTSSYY